MNRERLRQLLPNASASMIALNADSEEAAKDTALKGAPKGRQPNRTEREYELILRAQFPHATIRYEAYTLKLAEGCRYVPDFAVEHADGTLEFYEIKGRFIFSKALTKPKTAAELFPQRFTLAQKTESGWEITPLRGKIDHVPRETSLKK